MKESQPQISKPDSSRPEQLTIYKHPTVDYFSGERYSPEPKAEAASPNSPNP